MPTHYVVDGSTLVQVIDHSAVTAYPIIADPCWRCLVAAAGAYLAVGAVASVVCTLTVATVCVIAIGITIGATRGAYRNVATGERRHFFTGAACGGLNAVTGPRRLMVVKSIVELPCYL